MDAVALDKAPTASKKWWSMAVAVVAGVVLGIVDAVLRLKWSVGIPEQAWDLVGQVSLAYLGTQGVVDLGVRVSAILRSKATPAAVQATTAAAASEVAALSPAGKSAALADTR